MTGIPTYGVKTITSDGAVSGIPCRIMGIEIGDVAQDVTVELTNDADGLGTNVLVVTGAAEQGDMFRDYSNLGGILFASKCYCDLTNADSVTFWRG
jgi:hypothetical protein